jgi:hypothetical protein
MAVTVIVSEAKNLIDSDTYAFEILRLMPQNDVVGQPQYPLVCFVIGKKFNTTEIIRC